MDLHDVLFAIEEIESLLGSCHCGTETCSQAYTKLTRIQKRLLDHLYLPPFREGSEVSDEP